VRPYLARPYWIFDLDGTLTLPVHDFAELRSRLGIAPGVDILTAVNAMSPAEAAAAHATVANWEAELAAIARPQEDALALLEALKSRGATTGILTRNRLATAIETLQVAGLSGFFEERNILGRECATPKPSPDGLRQLLERWEATPEQAVMVGDYIHDVRAGRAAGVGTILIERSGPTGWDSEADYVLQSLVPNP
jgi:HAD superfamily hydrolase (TIGR01509 family)